MPAGLSLQSISRTHRIGYCNLPCGVFIVMAIRIYSCVFFCAFVTVSVGSSLKRSARAWCTDKAGIPRGLNEQWRERDLHQLCRCEYPESREFAWNLRNPSDAEPFCQLEGCLDLAGRFLVDGDTFYDRRGYLCVCRRGTDPYLVDAVRLFHTECSLVLNDTRQQIPDSVDHHIPEHLRDAAT